MSALVLVMDPGDEVGVCIENVDAGTTIEAGGHSLVAAQDIPAGHKVALAPIAAGSEVHKYGQPIGVATAAIAAGQHVHVHNLDSLRMGGNKH